MNRAKAREEGQAFYEKLSAS